MQKTPVFPKYIKTLRLQENMPVKFDLIDSHGESNDSYSGMGGRHLHSLHRVSCVEKEPTDYGHRIGVGKDGKLMTLVYGKYGIEEWIEGRGR